MGGRGVSTRVGRGGILLLTVGKLKTKQSTQHLLQIFVPGEFDKKPPQKGPLWHHFGT